MEYSEVTRGDKERPLIRFKDYKNINNYPSAMLYIFLNF